MIGYLLAVFQKKLDDYYKNEFFSPDLVVDSKFEKELPLSFPNSMRTASMIAPLDIKFTLKD